MSLVADTVRSHPRPGSNSDGNIIVAAPLSHGSNPNSNMAGRRREDDENLVAVPLRAHKASEDDENLVTAFHPTGGGAKGLTAIKDGTTPGTGTGAGGTVAIASGASVRRLTPEECEALQALPRNWTNPDGKAADSRRYAALGDAVTASVGEWIGRRILEAM